MGLEKIVSISKYRLNFPHLNKFKKIWKQSKMLSMPLNSSPSYKYFFFEEKTLLIWIFSPKHWQCQILNYETILLKSIKEFIQNTITSQIISSTHFTSGRELLKISSAQPETTIFSSIKENSHHFLFEVPISSLEPYQQKWLFVNHGTTHSRVLKFLL